MSRLITGIVVLGLLTGSAILLTSWPAGPEDQRESREYGTVGTPHEATPPTSLDDRVAPRVVVPSRGAAGELMLAAKTPEDVREVLRIERDAGQDDVPLLREMASLSEDPLVVGNAIRALGRLCAVSQDSALLALLDDPRCRVKQELVVALGRSGDPSALPRLLSLLEQDDPGLRPLVIQALGRLGDKRAEEPLRAIAHDSQSTNTDRVFAREALRCIKELATPRRTVVESRQIRARDDTPPTTPPHIDVR
ncbi:MAG: HEAT repeat domain-containing protein [Planctomycetota bacterium]